MKYVSNVVDTVDKIIISQESFGRFVNDVCPGAYQSMTHVNFSALDQSTIKPVGIYGSKSEIVRYFRDLNLLNDETYVCTSPNIILYQQRSL